MHACIGKGEGVSLSWWWFRDVGSWEGFHCVFSGVKMPVKPWEVESCLSHPVGCHIRHAAFEIDGNDRQSPSRQRPLTLAFVSERPFDVTNISMATAKIKQYSRILLTTVILVR